MPSNTNQPATISPTPRTGSDQQNTSTSTPPQSVRQRPIPIPLFTIDDILYAEVPIAYRQRALDIDNRVIKVKNTWDALPDEAKEVIPHTESADKMRSGLQYMLSGYPGDMNQDPLTGSGLIHRILLSLWRAYNPEIFSRKQANIG